MPVSLAALIISLLLPSPATGVTGAKSKVTWKILSMVDRDFPVQQPSWQTRSAQGLAGEGLRGSIVRYVGLVLMSTVFFKVRRSGVPPPGHSGISFRSCTAQHPGGFTRGF